MNRTKGKAGAKRVKGAENRAKAVELRKSGMTYERIGKALGISHQGARKAVQRAMQIWAEQSKESATELRDIEGQRVDAAMEAIWPKVLAGDLAAILRFVQLSARRASLFGLDMPTKISGPDGGPVQIEVRSWADIAKAAKEAREAKAMPAPETKDGGKTE